MKFSIYGNIPQKENKGEMAQWKEAIDSIYEYAAQNNLECNILSNFNYSHTKGEIMDNDSAWNGEFDLIVIFPRKIIIYELKSKRIFLRKANTRNSDWDWNYIVRRSRIYHTNFFQQVSKQRAYFLRDYLNHVKCTHVEFSENDFQIDSRLVLANDSKYHRFRYAPPIDYDMRKFEENILRKISNGDDRSFISSVYTVDSEKPFFKKQRQLEKDEYTRLWTIFHSYPISVKCQNWFKIITTQDICSDLNDIDDYDSFEVNQKLIDIICDDYKLNKLEKW